MESYSGSPFEPGLFDFAFEIHLCCVHQFVSLLLSIIPLFGYAIFIHSYGSGYLDCVQFLSIMSKLL